jgi:hypothetical protein
MVLVAMVVKWFRTSNILKMLCPAICMTTPYDGMCINVRLNVSRDTHAHFLFFSMNGILLRSFIWSLRLYLFYPITDPSYA